MNYYNEIKNELINNEIYKRAKDYSKNRSDLNTYYKVGKIIIEAQGGEKRAKYGDGLIKEYSLLIKKFENNVDSMLDLYEYSENIRKLIYTTNPVESLNSCIRKVTNGKGCFVSLEALEKVLYLRIKDLSEKWKRNTKAGWSIILNELIEIYGERVEKYINI